MRRPEETEIALKGLRARKGKQVASVPTEAWAFPKEADSYATCRSPVGLCGELLGTVGNIGGAGPTFLSGFLATREKALC